MTGSCLDLPERTGTMLHVHTVTSEHMAPCMSGEQPWAIRVESAAAAAVRASSLWSSATAFQGSPDATEGAQCGPGKSRNGLEGSKAGLLPLQTTASPVSLTCTPPPFDHSVALFIPCTALQHLLGEVEGDG